jgi:hypothetical protein
MTIESWLAAAVADAERRGLPELKPILETLARAARAARGRFQRRRERDAAAGRRSSAARRRSSVVGPAAP